LFYGGHKGAKQKTRQQKYPKKSGNFTGAFIKSHDKHYVFLQDDYIRFCRGFSNTMYSFIAPANVFCFVDCILP
jgi:hypothetical protein